jgi:hypothetical protein
VTILHLDLFDLLPAVHLLIDNRCQNFRYRTEIMDTVSRNCLPC